MSADVPKLTSAPTVLGQDVTLTVRDGKVFLHDTVQVIITDIATSNGVIYMIDAALLSTQEIASTCTKVVCKATAPQFISGLWFLNHNFESRLII